MLDTAVLIAVGCLIDTINLSYARRLVNLLWQNEAPDRFKSGGTANALQRPITSAARRAVVNGHKKARPH